MNITGIKNNHLHEKPKIKEYPAACFYGLRSDVRRAFFLDESILRIGRIHTERILQ